MAILQCLDFLDQYPHWKIVESEDTALSAQRIYQSKSKNAAAIASTLAADLFNLQVLCPDIHTMKQNYTRFLVLEKQDKANSIINANKASVYFYVENKKGSLANVLKALAEQEVNLSKLQSFPIPGSNWLYSFHADLEFDAMSQFEKTIIEMKKLTDRLNVYGIYKKGN
jgi:prephenate dehydratase